MRACRSEPSSTKPAPQLTDGQLAKAEQELQGHIDEILAKNNMSERQRRLVHPHLQLRVWAWVQLLLRVLCTLRPRVVLDLDVCCSRGQLSVS